MSDTVLTVMLVRMLVRSRLGTIPSLLQDE